MMPITLNEHDCQQRAHTCKTPADRRRRDRCQALLMADRGRRHHQSAADVRGTARPLQRWLHASRPGGLAGLTLPWGPGRAPHLPEPLAPASVAWGNQGPAGWGLDRAHWPAAALAPSRYQTQGSAVSERPRRACWTKPAVRPDRPTSPYLTGDPDQQEAARQALET